MSTWHDTTMEMQRPATNVCDFNPKSDREQITTTMYQSKPYQTTKVKGGSGAALEKKKILQWKQADETCGLPCLVAQLLNLPFGR